MDTATPGQQDLIRQARDCVSGGDMAGAARLYRLVLRHDPSRFDALCELAGLYAHQGNLEEAITCLKKALCIHPGARAVLEACGALQLQAGRPQEAIALLDQVLAQDANAMPALFNRALAQALSGQADLALGGYDRVIALHPKFLPAWLARGNLLRQQGHFDKALTSFHAALACDNTHTDTHHATALLLVNMGQAEAALPHLDQALIQQPSNAAILFQRARVLRNLGRSADALPICESVIARNPQDAHAFNLRGTLLTDLGHYADALASYSQALRLEPGMVEVWANRGLLYWNNGRQYDKAVSDLEHAMALGSGYAHGELMHIRMYGADWRTFDADKRAIDEGVRKGTLAIRPFAYQALSQYPEDLARCSRTFAKLFPARPFTPFPPSRRDKIHLGYLSADFRDHATAYLIAGLIEQHDRSIFEVFAIDNGRDDGSMMRRRLLAAFDHHITIAAQTDHDAAMAIRAADIDILVNLNGYFGDHRMGVFARRPAPVQVNYLGFPATLGAPCMDYIVADPVVIPDGEQAFYDEKVVWLPNCYQVNDSARTRPGPRPSRAQCGLPEKAFVFCNFNQTYKLTPDMFASWMRILCRVPDSVLWLQSDLPAFQTNIAKAAHRCGADPARIVVAPYAPVEQHLARLALADLVLDTLPYNAHTTASDALWTGVPLVTCRGTSFPGRVAASLLAATGLNELVADTLADFEDLAVALANDPTRLAALRRHLEESRATATLFDTALFCRHIENAWRTMHDRRQQGAPPVSFTVPQ